MSVYTSKKEPALEIENEYTAQIYPCDGKVYVEIICQHGSMFDRDIKLWRAIMNKSFGRSFASSPREKDYVNATKWMNEQFDLIRKYGTAVIKEPEFLIQKRMYERMAGNSGSYYCD